MEKVGSKLSAHLVRKARRAGALLVVSIVATAHNAAAEPSNQAHTAAARAAAGKGVEAFDEERYAEAIDYFSRAEEVVHSPVHLLFLARSHAALGHLVKAHEAYMHVVNEVLPADATPIFKDAQAEAETEAAALQPRLPHITLYVSGADQEAVSVTMDKVALPTALIGLAQPVDPGTHHVTVSAPGMESTSSDFTVAEGQRDKLTLTLVPATVAAPTSAPAAPGQEPIPADTGADGGADGAGSWMTIGGYTGLGVGVVGLGLGTWFAIDASGKRDDAAAICSVDIDGVAAGSCPLTDRDKVEKLDADAESSAVLATTGFIVGGLGVAAGVTLLLLADDPHESPQAGTVRPWASGSAGGVYGWF